MQAFFIRMWAMVPPPRAITLIHTIVYALLAVAGYSALTDPPRSIEGTWGQTLTLVWGLSLLAGGAVATLAAPTGRWFIEKPALLLVATGVVMYGTAIIALQFQESGNRLVQLLFVSTVLAHLVVRFLRIHKYAYEPGR